MKKDDFDWGQWLQAVQDMRQKACAIVPKGWITADLFAANSKNPISESQARKILTDLHRTGRAERKKFNICVGDIGVRAVYHYRLK